MIKRTALVLALAMLHVIAFSQISITNVATAYTQDFNTLANTGTTNTTLPNGWLFLETGTASNTTYAADNGAANGGNTYSYGSTGATDRAFGTLQSGSNIPTIGVSFTNNSGVAITSITVAYTGEQWRVGTASRVAPDSLEFQYSLNATSLNTGTWTDVTALWFASPVTNAAAAGALDGNLAANQTAKSFTITGLNIANGATFYFRWNDFNVASSDDGLGIDDFSASFNGGSSQTCAEPAAQPTNLVLTPTPTTIAGSFTASVADQFMVVRSSSATAPVPVDGTNYAVGSTALGTGTSVISNGSGVTFTATGLTPSTQYYFYVYALNNDGCNGGPNYFNLTPLSGNATTLSLPACTAPAAAPTNLTLTATGGSVSGSFTASATANRYLTVISTSSTLSATPVNGTTYTAGSSFGGGTIVSYGSSTSFVASGLTASTQYYIFIFAANGDCNGEPFYNTTALTGNKSTTNTGIPTGYYDPALNLTCQPLKTALKNIITNGSQALGYTPGVWNIYFYSDQHRNDANTATIIWDMYSDNPTGAEPYTYTYGTNQCGNYNSEGDCYNREHSTPQSWFNSASPMVSDAHHLFPTDGKVNGLRNNYPYGAVTTASNTTLNGSKLGTGNNFGYTGIVFEPIDAYKGDFARAALYMATRYEDEIISQNWSANGNGNDVLLSTTDQTDAALRRQMIYDPWYLQTLIKWHNQDPPSQKEIDRNNAIYSQAVVVDAAGTLKAQGNRNPFVDHPEYVAMIWGTGTVASLSCASTPACTAPTAQPTALVLTPSATSIAGSFTAASPAPSAYLVVRSTASTLSATPANATTYTAGQSFGGGTIVQFGSGTTFNDASLVSSTTYYYFIFAANNTSCTGGPVYLTTSPLTGNSTTTAITTPCTAPTAQATALVLTPTTTSVSGAFTAASPAATAYLVVRSTASTLSANPVNATTYAAGQSLGGGTVIQYNNSTNFSDASLSSGTTYYYFVFAANNSACVGGPIYLTTAPLSGSTTTLTVVGGCTTPTALATNLVLSKTGSVISGSFTGVVNGNYLVLMTTSAGLTKLPVNGATYTAGQIYGNATVISFGNNTSFTANNIQAGKQYYFYVFNANINCTGAPYYNTASYLNGTIKYIKKDNIYPNPARNSVTLELYTLPIEDVTVKVTDVLGQVLHEQVIKAGQQTATINTSRLAAGKYFVTFYNYGIRTILPLIKK